MIRPFSRIQRSASVLAGLVVLVGCAAHHADLPPPTADPVPRPAATPPVAARPRPDGHIAIRPGRVGHVVAASHGAADAEAGDIAVEIARRTGFGLVVASGLARPDNGRPLAREMSELYEQRVLQASQGPLRFYAEIHGGDGAPCAAPIEIATVGVDRELALRLRALAELIRDAHLRTRGEIDRLAVLIEPVDPITDRTAGARRDGILRLPERALHIELPRCARRDWREAYTAILADFLAQAVALPIGR
jgi:hypothetical protein